MKILDIYAKGYAGATMGGTSFMVNIDVPKDRFPELEENGNDGYMLNILIPNPEYGSEPKFSLSTKLIDKEDGSISLWGEEAEFTEEEMTLIKNWYEENKIDEQAEGIKKEIDEITKKLHQKHRQYMSLLRKKCSSAEEMDKRFDELDKIDNEIKALRKRDDFLHGIY